MTTALVIENDPGLGIGRAAEWLAEAGMELDVVRAHAGEPVPGTPGGHEAVIALGGGGEWHEELTGLLECAVADATATLALSQSALLLAGAHGAEAEPAEVPVGARMLAKRDAAGHDPLFGPAPMTIDVYSWRDWELRRLPEDATLLAASPYGSLEVFRIGGAAWGVASHFEVGAEDFADVLDEPALAKARAADDHIVETWRPIVQRFARIAAGERRALPVVDA